MPEDSRPLEEVLEKASRVAKDAEVFHLSHWDEPVIFEANKLKLLERRESSGLALRLIKDGRIGFSSTTKLEDTDAPLHNALETIPFGAQAMMEFPSYHEFTSVEVYDAAVETWALEEMIELGQTIIDGIRAHEPELLCDASISRGVTTVTLLNSRGGYASYSKSLFRVSISASLIEGTDMFFLGESKISCHPLFDPTPLVDSIAWQLELGRSIAPPVSGEMAAVFTPKGTAGALLSPLLSGFNGKAVLQGSSPLVGKFGEQLLDEKISIWDEPDLSYVPGSRMCDDEGVATRRMALVDRGTIRNFVYDLQTAGQARTQSTGNAHRSLNSLPVPGTSVTVVPEGDASFDDMISDMKRGIVVERLLGVGQGNTLGGDFNANVLLGYQVEKGKIIGRLKNTVINGNVYTVLKELQGLGQVGEWVGGSLRTPSIYCNRVSVATRK